MTSVTSCPLKLASASLQSRDDLISSPIEAEASTPQKTGPSAVCMPVPTLIVSGAYARNISPYDILTRVIQGYIICEIILG